MTDSPSAEVKLCLFCGETVRAVAIRCKHCHADLSSPPVSSVSPLVSLESSQILDLLARLVEKNLVVYEERADGFGRYRLLETVRRYSQEKMAEGADKTFRGRHRAYFLEIAEESREKLRGSEQSAWLERLETEHDNLRAAIDFSLSAQADEKDALDGLRLGAALNSFWDVRGHLREARERLRALLSQPKAARTTRERAGALLAAGSFAYRQGEYGDARALLLESLTLHRERGHPGDIALSLINLGNVMSDQGDYDAARAFLEESLTLQRAQGNDAYGLASSLNNLGLVLMEQGNYPAARPLLQECLTLWQGQGSKSGLASVLDNLGFLLMQEENFMEARDCLTRSLSYCRELGDRRVGSSAMEDCADLSFRQGQFARAARLSGAAQALREAIGNPLPPKEHAEREGRLQEIEAALGKDAYAAAYAAGLALTFEQAVENALEDE